MDLKRNLNRMGATMKNLVMRRSRMVGTARQPSGRGSPRNGSLGEATLLSRRAVTDPLQNLSKKACQNQKTHESDPQIARVNIPGASSGALTYEKTKLGRSKLRGIQPGGRSDEPKKCGRPPFGKSNHEKDFLDSLAPASLFFSILAGLSFSLACPSGHAQTNNWLGIPVSEFNVLVDLYTNTAGQTWDENIGWTNAQAYSWYGVTVYGGHVIELELGGNNLIGSIPASLADLSQLQLLDLWGNQLSGSIPASLGNLSPLEYLDLEGNQLSGSIPAQSSTCSSSPAGPARARSSTTRPSSRGSRPSRRTASSRPCARARCSGAAGRLRGRRATTHATALGELAAYGATAVRERVVDAGQVVTAGGVTSGLDLGIHLVRRLEGDDAAGAIARQMEWR